MQETQSKTNCDSNKNLIEFNLTFISNLNTKRKHYDARWLIRHLSINNTIGEVG